MKNKITDPANVLWDQFLENANIGDLHPYDHRRWQAFVIQTHRDDTELSDEDVRRAIKERYPSAEETASRLSSRFLSERELLKQYDRSRN